MKFLAIQKVSGGHFIDFEWADLAVGFGFPKILQPSEPSKTYNEISGELGANTVAIHIRLGDYLKNQIFLHIRIDKHQLLAHG